MINWSKLIGALMLLTVVTAGGVFWLKSRLTEHDFSTNAMTKQFIVGNDVLEVPLNMVRFSNQRDKSVLSRADLVMYWIDGTGFQEANRRIFLTPEGTKDLIFLTLEERKMDFDMSGRFQPIYSKLLTGPKSSGPAGLILQALKAGSGYDGEELAVSTGQSPPWIARCQKGGSMESPTCLRDIFAGTGLSLRYRFSRTLLPFWREIEQLVVAKRAEIVVTGRENPI